MTIHGIPRPSMAVATAKAGVKGEHPACKHACWVNISMNAKATIVLRNIICHFNYIYFTPLYTGETHKCEYHANMYKTGYRTSGKQKSCN